MEKSKEAKKDPVEWYIHKPSSHGAQITIRTYSDKPKAPIDRLFQAVKGKLSNEDYIVAKIPPQYSGSYSEQQRWDDASLIVLAPKMYRQLRDIAQWLSYTAFGFVDWRMEANMLEVKSKIEALLEKTTWKDN